jgi:hypothetical protein
MFCSYIVIGVNQFLADAGLYESQAEAVSREEVLGKLDQVRACSVDVLVFWIIVLVGWFRDDPMFVLADRESLD